MICKGLKVKKKIFFSGPPPGYEVPIHNSSNSLLNKEVVQVCFVDAGKTRRSPRLLEKYSEERVRYDDGKKKYNKKNNKPKKARLEYQKTLDPLERQQAELLVQMAGVEIQGRIEEEVAKIVMG